MVLFSLAFGASVGVYVMLPLYLVSDLGLDPSWVNTLIAWSRLASMAVVLGAGWVADWWGPKRTMFLFLVVGGSLTALLGVLSGPWLVGAIFLQSIAAACFWPVGFAVLSRIGPLGVSLVFPVAHLLGAGAIPAAMGTMADAGYFGGAMVLVGVLIVAGSALIRFVHNPEASQCT
jgi:NNP family nitrate/nitrite transporter-like MFS transporter